MRRQVSMVTDPNVVPMIDVLLVLLVIFMLGSVVLVRRAFDVQLPQPSRGGAGGASIVLEVSSGPTYRLNGRRLAPDDLEGDLRTVFLDRPEKVLFVKGERGLRYQDVVRAFDAARGAGVLATALVPSTAR